jgi:predicted RNA-binding protein associated with RNAse of E/G family
MLERVKVKLALFEHEVEVRVDELVNYVHQGLLSQEDADKARKTAEQDGKSSFKQPAAPEKTFTPGAGEVK